tara:strand:+ start:351 stop:1562 length:1212 start_codon:yes stop_codon:yes gene_type:complete
MAKRTGGFIGQDGLNAPDQATGVSASGGDTQVNVSFTSPSDVGGAAITGYRVQDSTGAFGVSGSSSPITVTGLSNGTSYTFNVWAINPFGWSSPSDASTGVTPVAAVYAMVAGFGSGTVNIDRFNISVQANAADFGDLTSGRNSGNVMSSATRTVFSCGRDGGTVFFNILDYVNPTSAGNATDFGDASYTKQFGSQFGSSTRGCVGGAEGPSQGAPKYQSYDTIDFITFASTGNASDFGNQTQITQVCAGFGSTTRGVRSGGYDGAGGGSSETNVMDYVTISSQGNAIDFGDMTLARRGHGGCSSSTRGLNAGGFTGSTNTNSIDYVTISNTGNATDFGDLIKMSGLNVRAASSHTVGAFIDSNNTIVTVTIASTGNATDFADLTGTTSDAYMTNSNGHGGLS